MDASQNPVDVLAELFGDDPRIDRQWMAEMRDFLEQPIPPEEISASAEGEFYINGRGQIDVRFGPLTRDEKFSK